jgi:hypothetical protein
MTRLEKSSQIVKAEPKPQIKPVPALEASLATSNANSKPNTAP